MNRAKERAAVMVARYLSAAQSGIQPRKYADDKQYERGIRDKYPHNRESLPLDRLLHFREHVVSKAVVVYLLLW